MQFDRNRREVTARSSGLIVITTIVIIVYHALDLSFGGFLTPEARRFLGLPEAGEIATPPEPGKPEAPTPELRSLMLVYERGCDEGRAHDCHSLGAIYFEGRQGLATDHALASTYYQRAYELERAAFESELARTLAIHAQAPALEPDSPSPQDQQPAGEWKPVNESAVWRPVDPDEESSTPGPATAPAAPIDRASEVGVSRDATLLARVEPELPRLAREHRISGTVVLSAVVSAEGVPEHLVVERGNQILGRAAIEAVRQWRYAPALVNGVPVARPLPVDVTFAAR
jgi:TonB family protein